MFANSYSLLAGNGEDPQPVPNAKGAAVKPKKPKKKKGTSAAPEEQPAPVITPPPAAPAPSAAKGPQTAKDAGQALESSAVAAGAGEWGSLALQWTDQVLHGDALYTDGSQLVDFKQVLLKCRALELLVEGCLERGSAAADAPALAHLLAAVAHPSTPAAVTQALAQAVAALGQVCGTDRLAPTPAAKRAAAAALGLVRRGVLKPPPAKPAEAPAAKLKRLGGELVRQEARLAGTTQPKELCKAYGAVLELLCGQLDVLGPVGGAGAPPQAPEVAAALQPLEELRAALATRLQEVQAPPKPQLSVAEQLAEAEASHRRDDAALVGRLSEVEGRIALLEVELAGLKGEAGELRSRRASAAQHHHHRLDAIRSGKPASGASAAEVAAAVQGGLAALEGLAGAVRGGGGEPTAAGDGGAAADAAALSQQVVAAEVPVKLLGAMQQVVELNLAQLHELGAKARFFRERLDKAVKQGEQAARLGLGDPKTFKQQRSTAENNVKEVMAAAEGAAAAARAAAAAYRERLPAMLRLPTFLPPPPEYLAAVEAKAAEAEAVLSSIRAGTYAPPQPAPAAPGPAPSPGAAPAAPAVTTPAGVAAAAPQRPSSAGARGVAGGEVGALEARLAMLEAENVKKDAQIAAMISSTTLEVPSPLAGRTSMPPAMLSSPTSNKPVGPAAPIAPAAPPPAAAATPAPGPAAPPAASALSDATAAPAAPPMITFSQALLQQPAQANGRPKAARPRRA